MQTYRKDTIGLRDGGRADFGIGGLNAGGIGEGNGPGYYNLKLWSEATAATGKQGFKVGREDEGSIQSSFLKLQYCNPRFSDPTFEYSGMTFLEVA